MPAVSDLLTTPDFRRKLDQCIHCGLCLPACPTYAVFHTEMESPRGRIALMKAASDGRTQVGGAFRQHIDLCLGCRACEPACPSGVQYGALLESARHAIEASRTPSPVERMLRRLVLAELMADRARLRTLARLLSLYQRLGLSRLFRRLTAVPPVIRTMEGLLPSISVDYPDYAQPAPALGEKRGEVAFLHGCVQDAFLSGVNAATVRVLQRNGYEVHFPSGQTCCGAAALHVGEVELARQLARRNIDACRVRDYAAIISNAGGCGAVLKEYAHILAGDPDYAAAAAHFAGAVRDISEFLAENLRHAPTGRIESRATYVDSCHLRHAQRVVRQPRALLAQIPGLQLVELRQPDMCCGSAGVYNILQAETAQQVLDAKMADVAATGADLIVTTNTGCHMQLMHGVAQARLQARVVHLVELLDRSYAGSE